MNYIKNLHIITFLAIISLTTIISINGCGKSDKTNTQDEKKSTEKQTTEQPKNKIDTTKLVKDGKYACPMHPAMQSNEPIKCPICKMNMELKDKINK
jgi:rubrerythrin